MCLFADLSALPQTTVRYVALLQVTYGIGVGFRRGFFNPLRRLLFENLGEEVDAATRESTSNAQVPLVYAGGSGGRNDES